MILIDGASIPHHDGFRVGSVLVRDDRIAAVAWAEDDRRQLAVHAAGRVDAADCWLLPGLIDSHAHAYAAILRGTADEDAFAVCRNRASVGDATRKGREPA